MTVVAMIFVCFVLVCRTLTCTQCSQHQASCQTQWTTNALLIARLIKRFSWACLMVLKRKEEGLMFPLSLAGPPLSLPTRTWEVKANKEGQEEESRWNRNNNDSVTNSNKMTANHDDNHHKQASELGDVNTNQTCSCLWQKTRQWSCCCNHHKSSSVASQLCP